MPKLFMFLIGCTPPGRHIEQHDIYFGIADGIVELIPDMIAFWPEAKGDIHIDAWREVRFVNGFEVTVLDGEPVENTHQLFFINLGGYKQKEFDVTVKVKGGGLAGQVDAIKLAIAKALTVGHADLRSTLKKAEFLRRDPREKERKKYGLRSARKREQYSKR